MVLMIPLMIVSALASSACVSGMANLRKGGIKTEQEANSSIILTTVGIGAAAALYLIASFNLGVHSHADIWDYDEITLEGMVLIFGQILGVIDAVECIAASALLLVNEVKNGNSVSAQAPVKATSYMKEAQPSAVEHTPVSPMPQGKVPAWKQVEMEKQNQ